MAAMALDGIRVICFGMGGAAPLATATLGDFGAEIIKVEPITGDWSRTTPGLGTREFNRNKKGIAINLKSADGIALAKRLVAGADVVMESFRPGVMDRLGLGFEVARAVNPTIVYCSVSAYGQTGPWKDRPGVDGIIQAVSGMMSVLGPDEAETPGEVSAPVKVPFPVVDMTAGLLAAQGILVALLGRERQGMGQHVDVSLLDAGLVLQKSSITRYLSSRELPPRTGSRAPYATPNQAYRTKDGHIMIAAYTPNRWKAFCCNVLGLPEVEIDPRFATRQVRQKHHQELRHIVEESFRNRSTAELLELSERNDLVCAPINTYKDVEEMEQVRYRHSFEEVALSNNRTVLSVAPAPKLSVTPGSIRFGYPEFIGQHTREILLGAGLDDAEISRLVEAGAIGVHVEKAD